MLADNPLAVTVFTPEKILYEGPAVSVSSVNKRGKYDILALHSNFISLVSDKIAIDTGGGKRLEFPVKGGVIRVADGHVDVFVGLGG